MSHWLGYTSELTWQFQQELLWSQHDPGQALDDTNKSLSLGPFDLYVTSRIMLTVRVQSARLYKSLIFTFNGQIKKVP